MGLGPGSPGSHPRPQAVLSHKATQGSPQTPVFEAVPRGQTLRCLCSTSWGRGGPGGSFPGNVPGRPLALLPTEHPSNLGGGDDAMGAAGLPQEESPPSLQPPLRERNRGTHSRVLEAPSICHVLGAAPHPSPLLLATPCPKGGPVPAAAWLPRPHPCR